MTRTEALLKSMAFFIFFFKNKLSCCNYGSSEKFNSDTDLLNLLIHSRRSNFHDGTCGDF